jgi:hypothetical protein
MTAAPADSGQSAEGPKETRNSARRDRLSRARRECPLQRAASPKMVYRGGCVAEYAEYLERSPSTYDEQIGVA